MNKYCLHCRISGRVQGVFFRATTQAQARQLGLTGWVKNTPDGAVEALLCGEKARVEQLAQWLWQGSPAAKVTQVETQTVPWQHCNSFEIV